MEHNHEKMLDMVRHELPTDELLCDLSDLFRLFGMTQSAISHQLKILKDANLVANRREGKTIYYFLSDDHVRTIIAKGFEHLIEERNENNEEDL